MPGSPAQRRVPVDWVQEERKVNLTGRGPGPGARGWVLLQPGTRKSVGSSHHPVEIEELLQMMETNLRYRGKHPEKFPTKLNFKGKKKQGLKGLFGGGT